MELPGALKTHLKQYYFSWYEWNMGKVFPKFDDVDIKKREIH